MFKSKVNLSISSKWNLFEWKVNLCVMFSGSPMSGSNDELNSSGEQQGSDSDEELDRPIPVPTQEVKHNRLHRFKPTNTR